MLKQVNRERLRAVTDSLQTAQCATNYYKGEVSSFSYRDECS